ncbi:MAG: response regulator [Deltaproteobacteria bacterium]|nr:response regulator [Deltaproteobacteria bacterium]
MDQKHQCYEALTVELQEVRPRLKEAEETLEAIRNGAMDALVISGPEGEKVYSLAGTDAVYRTFFQTMEEGAATLNLQGMILSCNPKFSKILGSPIEKILGNYFQLFIVSEDVPMFITALETAGVGEAKAEISLHSERNDIVNVGMTLSRLPSEHGELICVVISDITMRKRAEEALGHAYDELEQRVAARTEELRLANEYLSSKITERKRAEEEREKLQSQLAQAHKMESVGILAGGIAHEFNNILQAILGYNSLILMDKTDKNPDYSSLQAIQNAAQRAALLVKQLLLFSRRVEIQRCPVELNQQVEHARRILGNTIPKMIDIEVNPGSRLWTVLADPVQIEQVLLNFGSNAADAMPGGGKIIIETKNITLHQENATHHPGVDPGNYVLLTVLDTGHGMDQETVDHIFDPFFTTKGIGKGAGLGLAAVYGIVKSHGGYITCHSSVGQGTAFKIYLPVIVLKDIPADKPSEEKLPKGGKETILLVDDEEEIRDFASTVLQHFGYTVITATSGEDALKIYSNKPDQIDLILLDIGIPAMGGHKCLQELLKIDRSSKVVIAGGYSVNEQVKSTLEAGAAGYVKKPYLLNNLLRKVRAALDGED